MTYSASLSAVIDTLATLLLHSLWQGALIGLLYALSLLYLRNAAPRARYGAALVALLALALAPALTGLAMALSASVPSVFSSPSPGELARSWAPVWGDAGQLGPLWVALWLAGVITLSIRVLWNWRRAQRLTHLGCHALSPAWETRLEVLARQLGVRRSVRLVESVLVSVPTVIGWLKPVILLPSSAMLGLNQRQLELIVAHELAHIARYDYVINYVLVTVETLWFHHPVVYLIGRGIRHERELCCDDLVISRCGSRFEYVSALTDIETLRSRHLLNEPLSNLAATGGDLLYRIRRIVKGDAPPSRSGGITATVAAFSLVLGGAMMAAPDDDHQVVASSVDAIVPPLERAPAPVIEMVVRAPAIRSVLDGPQMRALSLIGSPPARDAFELDLSGRSVARDSSTLEQLVVRPTGRPAFAAPTDIGDLRAALALADVVAEPEAAGPTRAMMSELDLVSPVLASLDDLRNDAARALNTPSSPYVASAPPDVTTGGELMVTTVAETTMDTGSTREQGGALIKRIEPRYPSRARLRGYTDTVQIEFVVTDTGEVGDIVIVSAESKPAFERAVVSAVRNWRYEPLLRDGVAVERTVIETFAFRLGGPDNVVKGVGCRRENNVFMCNTPGLNRIL